MNKCDLQKAGEITPRKREQTARESGSVEAAQREFGLGDHHLRMAKAGRKLYVEIDFIVPEDYAYDVWLTVEFTSDPTWGE